MAQSQEDNQLYFFSGKVLFLSLIFIAINIFLYLVTLNGGSNLSFREVAPRLVFAEGQEVSLQTIFDDSSFAAQSGQSVLAGSLIKTGEQSFAEIQLEGNSIRLDENTTVSFEENNFGHPDKPRFVFDLKAGSLWVNAFDPILIHSAQSDARFAQSVGMVMYSEPLNRVLAVTGNVDVDLYDENSSLLTHYVVPLKNQITFSDAQLQPVYSRLEYSKLKKELKMGRIAESVLEEAWVKRNTKDDVLRLSSSNHYIYSISKYHFLNRYHSLREKLALVPERKRLERLNLATFKLKYLLGAIQDKGDVETAEDLLEEFDVLKNLLGDDPLLNQLVEEQFFVLRNLRTDTPAYLAKEKLRGYIYEQQNDPELFRSYLADLDYLLRVRSLKQAQGVAETWNSKWKVGVKKKYADEFNHQSRIYLSLVLANTDTISRSFLTLLDALGDYRLSVSDAQDETLLEVANERLDVSKFLVASARYTDAKNYLKNSYANLNLADANVSVAARELFIKEATLIGDRIAFAETVLKGSAGKIDETKFKDYLATQDRDKSLAERFRAFIEETRVPDELPVVYPTTSEVVERFEDADILVQQDNIKVDDVNKFLFSVDSARLSRRADDGSSISFSAMYDYVSNAVYNVVLRGKALSGSYSLDDLVRVALTGDSDVVVEHVPVPDEKEVFDFLDVKGVNESERSQVIAQDLAIQLLMKELETHGITIPTTQSVIVLNKATLSEFRVSNAYIEDETEKREAAIAFEINTVTNQISKLSVKEAPSLVLPSQIDIEVVSDTVFTQLLGMEEELKEVSKAVSELNRHGLILNPANMKFTKATGFDQIEASRLLMKEMPIEFSGTYQRSTNTFLTATYGTTTFKNVKVNDFMRSVAEKWVLEALNGQGIGVTAQHLASSLPASSVQFKDYQRGTKTLSFTYDVTASNLINVSIKGLDTVIKSMTFEEFALISAEDKNAPKGSSEEIIIEESIDPFARQMGSCGGFIAKLENCAVFSCEFLHPITNEPMVRQLGGFINGKCRYNEQMPDNQKMRCDYTEDYLAAVLDQHQKLLEKEVMVTSVTFGENDLEGTFVADGITLINPAKDALTNGTCEIQDQ